VVKEENKRSNITLCENVVCFGYISLGQQIELKLTWVKINYQDNKYE